MKLFEITNVSDIESILEKYEIKNYEIYDGIVDVTGSVSFANADIKKLPVTFGKVTGNFDCDGCYNLETLEGSPDILLGSFDCANCTKLTSLKGAPTSIGGYLNANGCSNLTSIDGVTSIGGGIWLKRCKKLFAILGIFKIKNVKELSSDNDKLEKIVNKWLPTGDIIECQEELIEAGLKQYARLK